MSFALGWLSERASARVLCSKDGDECSSARGLCSKDRDEGVSARIPDWEGGTDRAPVFGHMPWPTATSPLALLAPGGDHRSVLLGHRNDGHAAFRRRFGAEAGLPLRLREGAFPAACEPLDGHPLPPDAPSVMKAIVFSRTYP